MFAGGDSPPAKASYKNLKWNSGKNQIEYKGGCKEGGGGGGEGGEGRQSDVIDFNLNSNPLNPTLSIVRSRRELPLQQGQRYR